MVGTFCTRGFDYRAMSSQFHWKPPPIQHRSLSIFSPYLIVWYSSLLPINLHFMDSWPEPSFHHLQYPPPPPHLHFVISLLVELFSEQSITHEDLLLLLWYKTWLWIPPHPCKRNWEIMSWWWNIKYVIALFSPPKIKSSHSSVTADCQLPRSNNKDIQ